MTETHEWDLVWVRKPQVSATKTSSELQSNSSFKYSLDFNDYETGCFQGARNAYTVAQNPTALGGTLEVRDDTSYIGETGSSLGAFVAVYETCPDTGTNLLEFMPIVNYVEFGDNQHLGPQSRIVNFYPAFDYALGRIQPTMKGRGYLCSRLRLS